MTDTFKGATLLYRLHFFFSSFFLQYELEAKVLYVV